MVADAGAAMLDIVILIVQDLPENVKHDFNCIVQGY